jgi:hypothetical protein
MNKNSVTVLVFKFSLDAMIGIILASLFTLAFLIFLLIYAPGYLWLWLPIAFFIIYIRFAKKSLFKTRIVDENRLTFSSDGITYGDNFYPANQIEVVAMYLYAFDNFEYRDGFLNGDRKIIFTSVHPGIRIRYLFVLQERYLILIFIWKIMQDFVRSAE